MLAKQIFTGRLAVFHADRVHFTLSRAAVGMQAAIDRVALAMIAAAGYFRHAIIGEADGMEIDIEPGWGLGQIA